MAKASAQRRGKRAATKGLQRTLAEHPCGECSVCCTAKPVEALGKPEGLPCSRLRLEEGKGGCGRYQERPAFCKAYECVWRMGAIGGPEGRPDKLGILFDLEDTHATGIHLLVARETRLGALDANMGLLHELAAKGHVLYLINRKPDGTERCRMMGAEELVNKVKEAAKRKLPLVMQ